LVLVRSLELRMVFHYSNLLDLHLDKSDKYHIFLDTARLGVWKYI